MKGVLPSATCACLCATLMSPVHAATVSFNGTLEFIDPSSIPGYSAGDAFVGQFTYGDSIGDTTSPPVIDPQEAFYPFVGTPFSATLSDGTDSVTNSQLRQDIENDIVIDGGFASMMSGLHGVTVTVGSLFDNWNINAWPDAAMLDDSTGDPDPDYYTGGGVFFSIDVTSLDPTLYSGVDFQAVPPALGGDVYGRFRVVQRDAAGAMLFDGTGVLTSLTIVPLPPAAWLFGTALLGLAGLSGRNRTT